MKFRMLPWGFAFSVFAVFSSTPVLSASREIDFGLTSALDGRCYYRVGALANPRREPYEIISKEVADGRRGKNKDSMLYLEVDFDCLKGVKLNRNFSRKSLPYINLYEAFILSNRRGCDEVDEVLKILGNVKDETDRVSYRQARFMEARVYETCAPRRRSATVLYLKAYEFGFVRAAPYIARSSGIVVQ